MESKPLSAHTQLLGATGASEGVFLFPQVTLRVCAWCRPGLRFCGHWVVSHGICEHHRPEMFAGLGELNVGVYRGS